MYLIGSSGNFENSLRKLRRSGKFDEKILEIALALLARGESLPAKYQDHQLRGAMCEIRQCHLRGYLLLQYRRDNSTMRITLADIGTHHEPLGR